jgi:hypothetical protein
MKNSILSLALASLIISGCASVPMAGEDESDKAKQFTSPSEDQAGIYLYRKIAGGFGAALKKDIWIDGKCIGETASGVFFYEEVAGNEDHTIATESEFSPNELVINTKSGNNYFVEQFLKMGAFVGGAGVKSAPADEGKMEVAKLEMATKGKCSK